MYKSALQLLTFCMLAKDILFTVTLSPGATNSWANSPDILWYKVAIYSTL